MSLTGDPDFTTTVVNRTLAQNVLDTIRTHAGSGPCPECGNDDEGDGSVAFIDVTYEGRSVEAIALIRPANPADIDGPIEAIPLALVLTDEMMESIGAATPADVEQ